MPQRYSDSAHDFPSYVNCISPYLYLAAKTIDLDGDGKAANVGKSGLCSQTAAKVVELQELLPRARIVYCSATSVTGECVQCSLSMNFVSISFSCIRNFLCATYASEPKNLGFMSRLGLWGPGE
jgi:hypothetical protein